MVDIKCIMLGEPNPKPFLATRVNITNFQPTNISFLIDTGSSVSFISPSDATRMGIVLNNLPSPPVDKQIYGVGGIIPSRDLGLIGNCDIKFMSDSGWWYHLFFENFIVLKYEYIYKLPSVLGVDFLREFSFKLHIDFSRNIVELSTGEEVKD